MKHEITFLLNGAVETVADISPTTTLLQYLRRHKRLTGTKEGCAEGDCGACTVTVAELVKDGGETRVRHRAVNACIQFLPMLEGKAVTTVEALGSPRSVSTATALHPVQEAMVAYHASQCGFCTPGFVMSLHAAHNAGEELDRAAVNDLLAGNLCRCTGYGPIIEAALSLDANASSDTLGPETDGLQRIASTQTISVESHGQRYFGPASMNDLAGLVQQHPTATIVAGATDVGLWVTKQHRTLETVIDIGRVDELKALTIADGVMRIGAGVTYTEAFDSIAGQWPDFGEMLRRLGGRQVRNAGTIGGNIANGSPIGDTPPALIALGATLVLRKGKTQRRLPLENYFIDYGKQDRQPGEFVEAVEIPLDTDPDQLKCYKISKRFDQDISAVCGCFSIRIDSGIVAEARIAFGGMAATPKRAAAVEKTLIGQPWNAITVENAIPVFAQDYQPISDIRASADYRLLVAQNLLRRYFHESQNPLAETRLVGAEAAVA